MVLFVFAVIFGIIGVVMLLVGTVDDGGDSVNLRPWSSIAFIIDFIMFAFSLVHSVGAREVGIPVMFGHIGPDLQPGVHILAPWTVIHACSLTQQQSIQTQNPSEGDQQGQDGIQINGSDQGQGIADVTVLYHFDPAHANTIYRKYGCDPTLVKNNLIRQALKGAVPAAAARYSSLDIKNNRPQIQTEVERVLNDDFANDGIIVDGVIVSQVSLSDAVQQAANAKLTAQQAAAQKQFELQGAQTQKQIAQVNADAERIANDAKATSLTQAVLCEQFIQAIQAGHVTVLNTAGPCGGSIASGSSVIVNAGSGG